MKAKEGFPCFRDATHDARRNQVLRASVPASSLVQVSALIRPEFLIEIETIGHIAR